MEKKNAEFIVIFLTNISVRRPQAYWGCNKRTKWRIHYKSCLNSAWTEDTSAGQLTLDSAS